MQTNNANLNKPGFYILSYLALLSAFCLFVSPANAQTLTAQQIDRIIIQPNQGGMGGGISFTFVVTKNNNVWESRRTHKHSNLISNKTARWETIDSTQNIFIKNIS